jgi:hypothetical protein
MIATAQATRETCPARRFFGSKKIGFVMGPWGRSRPRDQPCLSESRGCDRVGEMPRIRASREEHTRAWMNVSCIELERFHFRRRLCDRRYGLRKLLACPVR